jgi:aspartate--ammonia ligase
LKPNLNLIKVEAPLFVEKGTGVHDDLNGSEHAVSFTIDTLPNVSLKLFIHWRSGKDKN